MATLKQLRDIFAPVLAQYPDLVLHRRWLFRPPIEIAIIGLYVAPTGYASRADIWLSVLPLSRFSPPWTPGFNESFEIERVVGVPPRGEWVPGKEEESARIYEDIFAPEFRSNLLRNFDAKAVPFLEKVRGFNDIISWLKPFRQRHFSPEPSELIDGWIATMHGDFAAAADQLQAFFGRMGESYQHMDSENRQLEENIYRVLRTGDHSSIGSLLHAMEERTIAKYGLERFWRRTPFPFERR